MRHSPCRYSTLLLAVLALTWLTACSQQPTTPATPPAVPTASASQASGGPAKVGFIGPLSGPAASYGDSQKKGVELALSEINRSENLMQVTFEDSQLDPDKASLAARKLIDVNGVSAILGETASTSTLTILPLAERAKVLVLSPLASSVKLTGASPYFFRVSPSDSFQASVAAQFASKQGWKKAGVIFTDDDWGRALAEAFSADFKTRGGSVVVSDGLARETKDLRTALTKARTAGADFLYIPVHPDSGGPLLVQARELGLKLPILGTDSFSEPTIVEYAKASADGVFYVMAAQPAGPEWQAFAKAFQVRYGEKANYNAAAAYDATKLLAQALRQAPSRSGDALKDELLKVKDYKGASGRITFDSKGDVISKSFSTMVIRGGKSEAYSASK